MNKTLLSLTLSLLAFFAVSCGEKDIPEHKNFEGIYYDESTSDRAYFEKVATEVLGYIRPEDQSTAIKALKAFSNLCDTYSFPENFSDNYAGADARSLADALEHDDYFSLSRAVSNFVYSISRYKGLYQAMPDDTEWKFIEKRDDLAFKYWIGTQEYNMVLTGTGKVWTETYTHDGVSYTVEIPEVLDYFLYRGMIDSSNTIITAKIQTDGKVDDHLNLNVSMRFGNMQLDTDTRAKQSKLTESMILYVHNVSTYVRTVLVASDAEILGNNLCSISAWDRACNSESPLKPMFVSASSTTMLYKSIQIAAKISSVNVLVDNAGSWWDTYSYSNPKAEAQKAASALNTAVTAELRYCGDNANKVRATMGWEAYQEDAWGDYEDWAVRPTITFASDGATFDFESYFGNGRFLSIENTLRRYIKSYKSYWN